MKFNQLKKCMDLTEVTKSYHTKHHKQVAPHEMDPDKGGYIKLSGLEGQQSREVTLVINELKKYKALKKEAEDKIPQLELQAQELLLPQLDELEQANKIVVETASMLATLAKASKSTTVGYSKIVKEMLELFKDNVEVMEAINKLLDKHTSEKDKHRGVAVTSIKGVNEGVGDSFSALMGKLGNFIKSHLTKQKRLFDAIKKDFETVRQSLSSDMDKMMDDPNYYQSEEV